jgi:hypothetical protein
VSYGTEENMSPAPPSGYPPPPESAVGVGYRGSGKNGEARKPASGPVPRRGSPRSGSGGRGGNPESGMSDRNTRGAADCRRVEDDVRATREDGTTTVSREEQT